MKKLNGKQYLLFGLVGLVLIAGYFRWTEEGEEAVPAMADVVVDETDEVIESSGGDYFEVSRQRKDMARSESIEILNAVIENQNSSAEAKAEAQKRITETAGNIEKEAITESLIKAKGFEDCLVFIEEDSVSVVVRKDNLESGQVAQIQDIVITQTKMRGDKIRISSI